MDNKHIDGTDLRFDASGVDMDALHQVQVGILHELDRVCKKQGIGYYLAYGTLIGAVRNGKIIPWDDDIDVVVSWDDYETLMTLPKEEWKDGFFLQSEQSEPNAKKCYMKLRNSNTTLIEKTNQYKDINHGIAIDIYPLIHLADDLKKRKQQLRYALGYMFFTEDHVAQNHGIIYKLLSGVLIHVIPHATKVSLRQKCKEKMLMYQKQSTEESFVLSGKSGLYTAIKNHVFIEAIPHRFEDGEYFIPSGYNEWLSADYGEDYMIPPAENERGVKLEGFVKVDTKRPYTYYKNKLYFVNK